MLLKFSDSRMTYMFRVSLAPCLNIFTDKRMNSVVNASTGLRHTWILHFYDSISLKAPASSSHSAIPSASWLQRAASDFPGMSSWKTLERAKKSRRHRSTLHLFNQLVIVALTCYNYITRNVEDVERPALYIHFFLFFIPVCKLTYLL